jgi:outer membrane receptor protein involved in Fe transport
LATCQLLSIQLIGSPVGAPIGGMPAIGAPSGLPINWIDNNWQVANTWSWNPNSRHSFRFGGDVRHLRVDDFRPLNVGSGSIFEFEPGPTASPDNPVFPSVGSFPNSFASFLLGAPTVATSTLELLDPSYRRWFFSGFASDTIRVSPKLTLELGVRYELFGPAAPRRGDSDGESGSGV